MANPKSVASGQWLVLIAAFLGWMFDGLEMGIFPLVARPALLDMTHGAGGGDEFVARWMGRITALFLVGAACGGLSFGWLGDRLGRVSREDLGRLRRRVGSLVSMPQPVNHGHQHSPGNRLHHVGIEIDEPGDTCQLRYRHIAYYKRTGDGLGELRW